jgi:uncharacterized membrane protein YgcG
MMITCPKCGFTQPKDQYCARCGVDMVAFKRPQESLKVRILKSVIFQVSLFVILIAGGFSIIRYQNRLELAQRVSSIENATDRLLIEKHGEAPDGAAKLLGNQPVNSSSSAKSNEAVTETLPTASPTSGVATSANSGLVPQSTSPTPNDLNAEATPPGPSPVLEPSLPAPTSLRVTFIEIGRPALAELTSDANATSTATAGSSGKSGGSFGGSSGGSGSFGSSFQVSTFSHASDRIKASQFASSSTWKNLEPTLQQSLRANQPVQVFRGTHDEALGRDLGLTLQVTPLVSTSAALAAAAADDSPSSNGALQIQIEVLRRLPEPGANPPLTEQTFQELFSIPRGGAAIVTGSLPHRNPLTDEEARFYSGNPILKVLTSPAFQNGTTEFAVLIEPR